MFNKEQVYNIIEQTLSEHQEELTLSDADKYKTYTTYKKLMSENRNVNKTNDEQESLISAIIIGRNTPNEKGDVESWDRIFIEHSDAKHLTYFDNFLKEGETEKVINALKRNGLSTDVLKGVRKDQAIDTTINGVTVKQEVEEDDDGYKYVSYFEIIYEGKSIYKYDADGFTRTYNYEDILEDRIEEFREIAEEYSDEQKTKFRRNIKTKNGKIIEDYYATSKGNVAKRVMGYYIDKNDNRRFGFISGGVI